MKSTAMFASATRPAGDRSGVFEYDGETGYFYLCSNESEEEVQILDSIHLLSEPADFTEADVSVCWDRSGDRVGLLIGRVVWAVFDTRDGLKYGGGYRRSGTPPLSLQHLVGDKR